jgi:hypothetical protein
MMKWRSYLNVCAMREIKCSCVNINIWCGLLHKEIAAFSRPLSRLRWVKRFISICWINSFFHSWNNTKLQLPSARWGKASLQQDCPSRSQQGDPWALEWGEGPHHLIFENFLTFYCGTTSKCVVDIWPVYANSNCGLVQLLKKELYRRYVECVV